jgi:hypothetical protein
MRLGAATARPDANTTFLTRFNSTTPRDEVASLTGTLRGNAFCDTANSELVLDGTGDYCEFAPGGGSMFDVWLDGTGTLELHTNVAATQVGGLISRVATGSSRYALYCSGSSGNVAFYADSFSTSTPVLNANILDGNWHHIAIVRNAGGSPANWSMWADGAQVSTSTWGSGPAGATADNFYIGDDIASLSTRDVAGRIARVKLSSTARYTSAFTPPARTSV